MRNMFRYKSSSLIKTIIFLIGTGCCVSLAARNRTAGFLSNKPDPLSKNEFIKQRKKAAMSISSNDLSNFSIFAGNSIFLRENSEIRDGDVGVMDIGETEFLDSGVELSIGNNVYVFAKTNIKANRISIKKNADIHGNVYYNELNNKGKIHGLENTPLALPITGKYS